MATEEFSTYHGVSFHPTVRLSPNAAVLGNVTVGENTSIFGGTHLRGDDDAITIGSEVNVQENVIMHVSPGEPIIIHDHCMIGHGSIIHGCEIGENTLVGMGSIVLNDAKIGANCIVAAGSIVTEHHEFPDNSMIMGAPARLKRIMTDEEVAQRCTKPIDRYLYLTSVMMDEGILVNPEPGTDLQRGW